MSDRFNVVVVTGLSGAGRSTALRALEDLGFFCVDNLPPAAFSATLAACARGNLRRIALGIDVRVRSFLGETVAAIEQVEADQTRDFTLVYLHASDASLLARFNATRRPHPLRTGDADSAPSLAVLDGIRIERERLEPLRERASVVIDTSDLSVHDLRRRMVELFRPKVGETRRMRTRFVSFGFKYGAPADVDVMFDVRFIENPYFVDELRNFSGLDAPVRDFVRANASAAEFRRHTEALLGFLIPAYEAEGKSYLTVGFGCTGGRHRSVAIAEAVAEALRPATGTMIEVVHRDIDRVHSEQADAARVARVLADDAGTPTRG